MRSKLFPTIVVDNFFENPDAIRGRALNLDFMPSDGAWPGKRTLSLNEVDQELFNYVSKKLFSVHYDFLNEVQWELNVHFQLIEPFSNDKHSILNRGWIHHDACLLSGIVYLTPNADPETGTSIFKVIDHQKEKYLNEDRQDGRVEFYKNQNVDIEKYTKELTEFNSNFIETINVKNIYNRLISFDSNEWHAANNFHSGTETRLTLVYFVNSITSVSVPALERIKQYTL